MPPRKLTRDAVVEAAVAQADAQGIDALTMRSLARELGVEAMSLYHHVANKEALLDAMVDAVYAEYRLASPGGDWREELRLRSESVRATLVRHPWALPLIESRLTPGPATLAAHDANIACLRAAGFAPRQVALAYALLDAFTYGFVLQQLMVPFSNGDEAAAFVQGDELRSAMAAYPNMVWFTQEVVLQPGYSFEREFEPGLDLVLDAIASLKA